MKGVDYLRGLYNLSGLCIKPKEKTDIYDFVEDILRGKGYDIDIELLRRVIAEPHRTVCGPSLEEERKIAMHMDSSRC